ncbi:MAG: hypothetical protein GY833_16665, partial [Aestuariibacter sp.]|nr:hypothetical protein [Aestuariibacter sp.]
VRAGAIVTFDAVEFALWMGCDPIVTIGNELSYERIQDVPKRNSIKKEQGRYTIPAFNTANVMFYIIDKLHPEVKKLDASGGIMNWEKVTLEEALLTYSPIMIGANNEKNTCNDMLNACCADGKSKCGNASMSR